MKVIFTRISQEKYSLKLLAGILNFLLISTIKLKGLRLLFLKLLENSALEST